MAYNLILQGDAETVLGSVNDFLKIDKEKESFEIAYRFIASRKKLNWTHDYEKLMILNIDLALLLKKPDYIIENLTNFRNNAQTGHVGSIESVFNHYILKMEENFQNCLKLISNPEEMFQEINEQDDAQSFHFNLLNTQEGKSKEMFKNAWRLLISAYKSVIELTSKNLKLEDIYVKISKHVFQTLFDYKAYNDFKCFCSIVKSHQQNILSKTDTTVGSGHQNKDLSNYETNRKLYDLRSFQLELCKSLDFMQESFQILEDLNVLLTFSRKRGEFYIEYYQNLATIFFKGGFYLFHAISLSQVFAYMIKLKGPQSNLEDEASRLVLATLSINSNSEEFFLPESLIEKYEVLLGISGQRKTIVDLHEELNKNVLNFCPENVKTLYKVCSGQTDIYEFSNDIKKIMSELNSNFNNYKVIITENCVYIVLKMLSKFYSNVTFDELKEFTLFIDFAQVKKMIAKMKFDKQLNIYMNYENCILEFKNNYFKLDDAINNYERFVAKLEKVNLLLKKKQLQGLESQKADEVALETSLIELFKNADQISKNKEALINKEQSTVPKEAFIRKKDNKKEKDEEEERRRLKLQKEHDKNMMIDRKMNQVKKAKIKDLLKINPNILVLGNPLRDYTDEEINQIDFSIFMIIEEELEKTKNETTNKMLERKYKIYDFYQREQFKIYSKHLKEENEKNEIDFAQIEGQIATINQKKQQMKEIVGRAEGFLGIYKKRVQTEKEKSFNEKFEKYRQVVTQEYKESILAEAERLYKIKLADDLKPKTFVRGNLMGGPSGMSNTPNPNPQNADANKINTLSRSTVQQAPPQEMKMAKRGENILAKKVDERPQIAPPLLARNFDKPNQNETQKTTTDNKPVVLSRQGLTSEPQKLQRGLGTKPAEPTPKPQPPQNQAPPAPTPGQQLAKRGENFQKK
jgi:hypothetical protein